jgi:hypothetical protein
MSMEPEVCNCRRPDPVVVDDLSTCLACGALLPVNVPTNETETRPETLSYRWSRHLYSKNGQIGPPGAEATHEMGRLTLHALGNVRAYWHARLDLDKGKKSVRLINLSCGRYDDPIQCSIHHVDLADNPYYEAVSYTWADEAGDSTPSSYIYCS